MGLTGMPLEGLLLRRAEKNLPELGRHIEVREVGSPRTMEHFTLNPRGAVYGWTLDLTKPGSERLDIRTPIPNLFLAGVWTRSGHGQLAALSSGREAAGIVLMMDRKPE